MSQRTMLLGTLFLSFSSLSYADAAADAFTGTEIGLLVSNYTYEETTNGEFFMDLKSNILGVNGSISGQDEGLIWKAEGSYQYGEMDYTSNGTGNMSGRENSIAEIRGLVGFPLALENNIYALPYLGFGYHYLEDDAEGMKSSNGKFGYLREQSYYYLPIGVEIKGIKLSEDWSIGFSLEYDLFLSGLNRTDFGSLGGPSLEFEQDEGMGLRMSVPITFVSYGFVVEPFIKYWDIEKSSSELVQDGSNLMELHEPENTTTEFGFNFSIVF